MGVSDDETGVVDCSVGSIVWVRRRNGSWWPGKILGTEELSAAHLMSPRSGTPVKLLGREDASVDWYNLEKSKRVKAFRCGEFDDCIARAESAQGMPPKKREKYARREDAILHALELEKQLVESKYGQSTYSNRKISKSSEAAKEIVTPSKQLCKHDNKHIHPIPHLKETDSTLKEMKTDPLNTEEVREESQLEGNVNNFEVIPRIRDMQDLGNGVPAAKHKLSSFIASHASFVALHDENTRPLPSGTLITGNIIQTYCKGYLGRKRKSHAVFPDESLVKKHEKRRPLVQVLQNNPELPVQKSLLIGEEYKEIASHAERRSSICLAGESSNCLGDKPAILNSMALSPFHFEVSNHYSAALIEKKASGSSDSTEIDPSGTDSLNSGADGDMLEHPDDATLEPRSLKRFGAQAQQHRSMSFKEEQDDLSSLANDVPRLFPQDLAGIGVSQWKNKGKRNNIRRQLGKKSTDRRRSSGVSVYGSHLEKKNFGTQGGNMLLISKSNNGLDDIVVHSTNVWKDLDSNDRPAIRRRGYCDDYSDCALVVPPGRTNSSMLLLVDVDVKVQSSYQREHVPMISLRSKLNGKAIVGHPIQVEAIEEEEDGSSEILLAGLYPQPLNDAADDDTAFLSMWKTARRTANFRAPRSHSSAKSEIKQTAHERLQLLDQDRKGGLVTKLNVVSSVGHKASTVRNSSSSGLLRTNKKFPRKPLKKNISLSSVPKTKFLSSIGVEQKVNSSNYVVNGLIKGDSGPTAVACIPVKLVFSRFFEELVGRHQ